MGKHFPVAQYLNWAAEGDKSESYKLQGQVPQLLLILLEGHNVRCWTLIEVYKIHTDNVSMDH